MFAVSHSSSTLSWHEAVWTGTGMQHFAIFLLEQLAWPRLAAQGLSRLGLGLECCCTECCEGEESQSLLGSDGIKPLISQTLLRRHFSAVWVDLCCAVKGYWCVKW